MNGLRRVRVINSDGGVKYDGDFLGWGVDYENVGSSIAQFTAALIENSDGHVELVHPVWMQFLTDSEAGL